ncbi:MAG: pentapeptide repeat-containing protein [Chloroflexota bacterium]|nr:pentapeptide repeat-containing protein [Chloroflexota bacterium]
MNNQDNFSPVREMLASLRDGLGRFVLREYKIQFSAKHYLAHLQETLNRPHPFENEEQARQEIDLQGWLTAIQNDWDEFFSKKLGHTAYEARSDSNVANARSFLFEIQNARNSFIAHETAGTAITDEDVFSLADTATRLLKAANIKETRSEAEKTQEIKQEFGLKIYSADTEFSEAEATQKNAATSQPEDQPVVQQSQESAAEEDSEHSENRIVLSGLNLSDMDLRGRNLHLAELRGADLSSSNLVSENLANMDLSNVKLLKANLSNAKLTDTKFARADLSDVILRNANLTRANLSHTTMERADLRNARIDKSDFRFANLTRADLTNPREEIDPSISTFGMNIEDYNILEDEWEREGVNFSRAILREANMQRIWLNGVSLTDADMTKVNLAFARMVEVSLNGAILQSADLTHCDFIQCDFTGANMREIIMRGGICIAGMSFENANMSDANLEGFNCKDAHFSSDNADLSRANLCDADLADSSLRNVNLTDAKLIDIDLERSDLTNSNLTRAVFKDANLVEANLSNTDLNETDFTGADLTCADFTGAKFYSLSTLLPDGSYWEEDTDMTRFTG